MGRKNGQRHYRGTANPAYIQAMREIRQSSAASPHGDKRTKRSRTRSAALHAALKFQTEED